MLVESFDYDLPDELIAQQPAPDREAARLLVVPSEAERPPRHTTIATLASEIAEGALLVVNDTKVIRARILGVKEGSGGKAEIFLVRRDGAGELSGVAESARGWAQTDREVWRAMARASKPLRIGARVLADDLLVTVIGKAEDGLYLIALESRDRAISTEEARESTARVPLPPYIRREASPEDAARYQTVFAREPGAIAAPTAGLHLTKELLHRVEQRRCEVAACTLHVGLGTFEPVKTRDLDDHPMHAEYFEVSRSLANAISRARERGAPVIAVGTTVVRALESAADPDRPGLVRPTAEETRLLIQPGYHFRIVDRLLTNFHLPRSTLLALVAAFAGTDRVLDAYRLAVRERYRFFSYGDAMLLTRPTNELERPADGPARSHKNEDLGESS